MSEAKVYAVGTEVDYHGSLTDRHGRYVVSGHTTPFHTHAAYPGGVAYNLSAPDSKDEDGPILSNVRGSSFTPVAPKAVANPNRTKVE